MEGVTASWAGNAAEKQKSPDLDTESHRQPHQTSNFGQILLQENPITMKNSFVKKIYWPSKNCPLIFNNVQQGQNLVLPESVGRPLGLQGAGPDLSFQNQYSSE